MPWWCRALARGRYSLALLLLVQSPTLWAQTADPPASAAPATAAVGAINTDAPPPDLQSSSTDVEDASADSEPLRYLLEGIEVRGNAKTRSRVVLRYIPFQPGDVLDVEDPKLVLMRYRLLGTGFFSDVQLSLKKGSRPGSVILQVDVVERNTLVVNDLWMGLGADADLGGNTQRLTAFAGIDAAETNLAGTGITLGTAVGLAQDQLALRLRFLDPAFVGTPWMISGELLYNDARDFFGNRAVVWDDPSQVTGVPKHAVISYKRFGGLVGMGRDLSVSSQLWLHYRLETIDDVRLPRAAAHEFGGDIEPIDFHILPGHSLLSTVRATLQHDTRDQPFLTKQGWWITLSGELSLAPFGSDYPYERLDLAAAHWFEMPWHHVLRLDFSAGAITGDAPVFDQYYVGDFSDFRPSRILGLNLDRRPSPNFLGTAISEERYGEYAAKVGAEYRIPLYRGRRSVYGVDFFVSGGAYALASQRYLKRPPRNYSGLALIPVDLTANLGLRADTSVGGFVFSFSNVVGLLPALSEGD
ncbi:MAG TPA: BamA/TamA family outer membrane protein [Polyangiaceae bacterium]|nr:BamA/TamA family outer membrane protein [Polyangiaceae bacterium]